MSADDVKKLDEQAMRAWDKHDINGFIGLFDTSATWVDIGVPQPMKGKDAFRQYMQGWYTAFPDMRAKTINRVVSETEVAAEVVFEGTHTGPLQGPPGTPAVPATGKKVIGKGTYFAKVRNGKIVEFHSYPDMAGTLMQLGLMGPPPSGAKK